MENSQPCIDPLAVGRGKSPRQLGPRIQARGIIKTTTVYSTKQKLARRNEIQNDNPLDLTSFDPFHSETCGERPTTRDQPVTGDHLLVALFCLI